LPLRYEYYEYEPQDFLVILTLKYRKIQVGVAGEAFGGDVLRGRLTLTAFKTLSEFNLPQINK
jgi:hypothetical protein